MGRYTRSRSSMRDIAKTTPDVWVYRGQKLSRTLMVEAVAATTCWPAEVDAPPSIDPAATHCRLVLIPAVKDGGKPAVVALGKPVVTEDRSVFDGVECGILARELVRQSLLIAARDELGAVTRDEVAGDSHVINTRKGR